MGKRRVSVYDIPGAQDLLKRCGVEAADSPSTGRERPHEPNGASARLATGQRILIVEDDLSIRTLLERALGSRGYHVASAADGRQALVMVSTFAPDAALVDVMMPGLDGFSFVVRLRRRATTADLPVVFISAKTDARSVSRGIALGARSYVTKPFKMATLLGKIERVVQGRKTRAA